MNTLAEIDCRDRPAEDDTLTRLTGGIRYGTHLGTDGGTDDDVTMDADIEALARACLMAFWIDPSRFTLERIARVACGVMGGALPSHRIRVSFTSRRGDWDIHVDLREQSLTSLTLRRAAAGAAHRSRVAGHAGRMF